MDVRKVLALAGLAVSLVGLGLGAAPWVAVVVLAGAVVVAVLPSRGGAPDPVPSLPAPPPPAPAAPAAPRRVTPSEVVPHAAALVGRGLDPSALGPALSFERDRSGLAHATDSCPGVSGPTSSGSAPVHALAPACSCVDELVWSRPAAADVLEACEEVESVRSQLPAPAAVSSAPWSWLNDLEEALHQLDELSVPAPAQVVLAAARSETLSLLDAARSSLTAPSVVAPLLDEAALDALELELGEDALSEPDVLVLFSEEEDESYLLADMFAAWRLHALTDPARARRDALSAAHSHLEDAPVDPAQLAFVPSRPPGSGETLEGYSVSLWCQERDRVLTGLVDRWEAGLASVRSRTRTVLVGSPLWQAGAQSEEVAALAEAFRCPAPAPAFWLPSLLARHLAEQTYELSSDAVVVEGVDDPDLVETALALWDPSGDGELSSLPAAVEAARRV